jgi:shikimate kinase
MPSKPSSFKPKWKPAPVKRVDYHKPEWSDKYNWTWRKARNVYIAENPLCVMCEAQGLLTPATVVDHVIPHKGDDTLFWDNNNWQSLCRRHHDRDKRRIENRYGRKLNYSFKPDWLKPIPTLTIVFGCPASGKTTYVKERAKPTDEIIDLDHLISDITGKPLYHHDEDDLVIGIRDRNNKLGELAKKPKTAWLILTGNGADERQWWIDKLQPREVVILDTDKDECIKRIRGDPRRPTGVKLKQIEAVRRWE